MKAVGINKITAFNLLFLALSFSLIQSLYKNNKQHRLYVNESLHYISLHHITNTSGFVQQLWLLQMIQKYLFWEDTHQVCFKLVYIEIKNWYRKGLDLYGSNFIFWSALTAFNKRLTIFHCLCDFYSKLLTWSILLCFKLAL